MTAAENPLDVLREALENHHWVTHREELLAALSAVEQLVEAARFARHSVDPNSTLACAQLDEALARFPAAVRSREQQEGT